MARETGSPDRNGRADRPVCSTTGSATEASVAGCDRTPLATGGGPTAPLQRNMCSQRLVERRARKPRTEKSENGGLSRGGGMRNHHYALPRCGGGCSRARTSRGCDRDQERSAARCFFNRGHLICRWPCEGHSRFTKATIMARKRKGWCTVGWVERSRVGCCWGGRDFDPTPRWARV